MPVHYATGFSCRVTFCSPATPAASCVLWRQTAPLSSPSPSFLLPAPSLVSARALGAYPRDSHNVLTSQETLPTRAGPVPSCTTRQNDPQQPAPGKRRGQGKMACLSNSSAFGSSPFAFVSLTPWPVASCRK